MDPTPEFLLLKKLPVRTRLQLMVVLALAGFTIQWFVSVGLGWIMVSIASCLGIMASRTNAPKLQRGPEWKSVTIKEFEALLATLGESLDVKRAGSAYSLGTAKGCFTLLLSLGAVIVVSNYLHQVLTPHVPYWSGSGPVSSGGSLGLAFLIDALTLLLPLWLGGQVRSWEPSDLRVKIQQLLPVYQSKVHSNELELQPQMLLTKTATGMVPTDVKLMIRISGSPDAFYGIQVQTTMNTVQGTRDPYTYAVLVAKPDFGLHTRVTPLLTKPGGGLFAGLGKDKNAKREAGAFRYGEMLVESKREADVHIAVVRQPTPGQGYTTSQAQAAAVIDTALQLARSMLKTSG